MIQNLIINNEEIGSDFNIYTKNLGYTIAGGIIVGLLLIGLIAFLTYLFIFKYRKEKQGFIFEHNVTSKLKDAARRNNMYFIEGGVFSYDGNMFDIDGILFNENIAIVVETKAYKDNISGLAESSELQITDRKGKKFAISNPILQNTKHIKHLYKLANLKFSAYSLIVLQDGATFNISNIPSHTIIINENAIDETVRDVVIETNNSLNKFDAKYLLKVLKDMKIKRVYEKNKFNNLIKGKK